MDKYKDKDKEVQTDKDKEIHMDKDNKEIQMDKDKEIQMDKDKEIQMGKDKEIQMDKDKEIQTDKDKEIRMDKDKEIRLDNDKETRTDNDKEIQVDNNKEIRTDDNEKEERCSTVVGGTSRSEFYDNAVKYWNEITADVKGMLGGFAYISGADLDGSDIFLQKLFELNDPPRRWNALDCGAGIGRVTKRLLLNHFDKVDIVEQDPKFVEIAAKKNDVKPTSKVDRTDNLEYRVYPLFKGLQDFTPLPKVYDVIWCQWVLGHLLDDDLVAFFKRCITGLRSWGLIVVKENVTSSGKTELDTNDSSVTRSLSDLKKIFNRAGLEIVRGDIQYTFPRGLYPVYMFALRPEFGLRPRDRHIEINVD